MGVKYFSFGRFDAGAGQRHRVLRNMDRIVRRFYYNFPSYCIGGEFDSRPVPIQHVERIPIFKTRRAAQFKAHQRTGE